MEIVRSTDAYRLDRSRCPARKRMLGRATRRFPPLAYRLSPSMPRHEAEA